MRGVCELCCYGLQHALHHIAVAERAVRYLGQHGQHDIHSQQRPAPPVAQQRADGSEHECKWNDIVQRAEEA